MNKNELSKRIDVSLKTLYNWEETKPELIKLIELGLQKEEELKNKDILINNEILKEIEKTIKQTMEEHKNSINEKIEKYFDIKNNKND